MLVIRARHMDRSDPQILVEPYAQPLVGVLVRHSAVYPDFIPFSTPDHESADPLSWDDEIVLRSMAPRQQNP